MAVIEGIPAYRVVHWFGIANNNVVFRDDFVSHYPQASQCWLHGGNWENNQQNVLCSGVTANSIVVVFPDPDSWKDVGIYGVRCVAQGDGTLTFSCSEGPETGMLTYNVLILDGVSGRIFDASPANIGLPTFTTVTLTSSG